VFWFGHLSHPVREDLPVAFREVWRRLGEPGTWWSGADRVAIATEGRRARAGEPSGGELTGVAGDAARTVGATPANTSEAWVDSLIDAEFTPAHYVELVSIAAQTSAIDAFHHASGLPLEPLPEPDDGEPSREQPASPTRRTRAWVPMTGPPSIPLALSAVPAEVESWDILHDAMYMSSEEMGDPDFRRALHRTQMELVAARTSLINQCFF
jgi:alkylhydroperoxidase family enzyme